MDNVNDDFDRIPVRLPSGTKAIVHLPRPFTLKDGVHLLDFLSLYIEDSKAKLATPPSPCTASGVDKPFAGGDADAGGNPASR